MEESTATGLRNAKWRETCTDGQYGYPVLPSTRLSPAGGGGQGLGAEARASEVRCGERTGVGCRETA